LRHSLFSFPTFDYEQAVRRKGSFFNPQATEVNNAIAISSASVTLLVDRKDLSGLSFDFEATEDELRMDANSPAPHVLPSYLCAGAAVSVSRCRNVIWQLESCNLPEQ